MLLSRYYLYLDNFDLLYRDKGFSIIAQAYILYYISLLWYFAQLALYLYIPLPTPDRQHFRRGNNTDYDANHHSSLSIGGEPHENCNLCPRVLPLHPDHMWCVCHQPPSLHPRPNTVHCGLEKQRRIVEEQCRYQYLPQRHYCCVHRASLCYHPSNCGQYLTIYILEIGMPKCFAIYRHGNFTTSSKQAQSNTRNTAL